jgi:hypothetical protein
LGRAQSNALDGTVMAASDDSFPDSIRLVDEDHQAAQYALQGVLRCERDGKSADADARDQTNEGQPDFVRPMKDQHGGGSDPDDLRGQTDQARV